MTSKKHVLATLCLLFGGLISAGPAPSPSAPPTPESVLAAVPVAGWVVDRRNNICGISDPRKISNPARVDYDACLGATKQIKEMKRKRIDPSSAEGRALRNEAKRIVTKACELVRTARGHCGVWKVIRHKDGRIIPDLTSDVQARL